MSLVQRVTPLEGTDRAVSDPTALTAPSIISSVPPSLRSVSLSHPFFPPPSPLLKPHHHLPSSAAAAARDPHPIHTLHSASPFATLRSTHSIRSLRSSHYGGFGPAGLGISGHGGPASLRHVLSYDVLPRPDAPTQRATHPSGGVSAYHVPVARRLAQVIATTLACWLSAGIVFGFAALKPVLVAKGVYRESCTAEELGAGVEVCYGQDLRLNFLFAIASTTCNICALPVGTLLDRYGPRVATMIGCGLLAVGTLLMAEAFARPQFDGYLAGYIFLALGGTFIFVPSFQIANAFPKYSGTIVALVTGAFDASAAVFLFYRLAFQSSNGAFTPEKFFYAYLIVPAVIFVVQLTLMAPDGYKTVPQLEEKIEEVQDVTRDVHDSDDELADREVQQLRGQRRDHRESVLAKLDELLGDADERQAQMEKREEAQAVSGVWGVLHGKSAGEQMLSPWFILITLLTVLQMLRMNYFIATVRSQYEYMFGSELKAREINSFFDVALPVGGVFATPFIGALIDGVSMSTLLAIMVAMTTVAGTLGALPFVWAGYSNVVIFVMLRPLYYSAMSDYAAKVFGFANFGRVYGAIICLSGIVNLAQSLIEATNHKFFHGNPIPINATLAALGLVIGTILVVYVSAQTKHAQQSWDEAYLHERDRLLPEMIEEEERFYGSTK